MNNKFADPKICPNCGQLYEGYDGGYIYNEKFHCRNCLKLDNSKPTYYQHIPTFVEGCDQTIFSFNTIDELLSKLHLQENCMFCYGDDHIMIQSNPDQKPFWWVLGTVARFDLSKSGLSKFNDKIYNI